MVSCCLYTPRVNANFEGKGGIGTSETSVVIARSL